MAPYNPCSHPSVMESLAGSRTDRGLDSGDDRRRRNRRSRRMSRTENDDIHPTIELSAFGSIIRGNGMELGVSSR